MSYGFAGMTGRTTVSEDGSTSAREIYVRDPGGTLIAAISDAASGTGRHYLTDHHQSVIATISMNGQGGVTRSLYEPYGETIRKYTDPTAGQTTTPANDGAENPNLTTVTNDNNPWGYASGYTDPTTGFIKFGTRYYMPQSGTWTQPDPVEPTFGDALTVNRYLYAQASPTMNVDPTGRFSIGDLFTSAGKVLGTVVKVAPVVCYWRASTTEGDSNELGDDVDDAVECVNPLSGITDTPDAD